MDEATAFNELKSPTGDTGSHARNMKICDGDTTPDPVQALEARSEREPGVLRKVRGWEMTLMCLERRR